MFFSWISFPQAPIRANSIFVEDRGDFRSSNKVHHRCRWHRWQMEKIRKVLILLFGHLWGVELTYRSIFFKVTSRFKQSNIFPMLPPVFAEYNNAKKVDHFYIPRWSHISNLDRPSRQKTNQDKMFISDLKTIYIDCLHYNECFFKITARHQIGRLFLLKF